MKASKPESRLSMDWILLILIYFNKLKYYKLRLDNTFFIIIDYQDDYLANKHDMSVKLILWCCDYISESLFTEELTLTLPGPSAGVSGSLDSYCSLKPLCSGMGEVVPACTSPTLLLPSPRTVLSLPCFKVLQCINCRD